MNKASPALDNLVRINKLKEEFGTKEEFGGLMVLGQERLADAKNLTLALSSRFDLAYNAAHAFSLAALRWHGYRSENRYLVFQTLTHTVKIAPQIWRVLAKAHEARNLAEYEGHFVANEQLLQDLIEAAQVVQQATEKLSKPR